MLALLFSLLFILHFHRIAVTAIVMTAAFVVDAFSFRFYHFAPEDPSAREVPEWTIPFDFSPQILGGFSYGRLALISVLGLFLELLMIRWVSSEISIFAYFKNFVLIACFLGFGLGCYLSRRPINLAAMVLPLIMLLLICELPLQSLRAVLFSLPNLIGTSSQMNLWDIPTLPFNEVAVFLLLVAALFAALLFGLIAFVFIPIGQLVGWYLENAANGIFGYTINILGSLAGIALYTLLCFLSQPPATWFVVAGAMFVLLFRSLPRLRTVAIATFLLCVGVALLGETADSGKVYWSPYQKLSIQPMVRDGEVVSYQMTTNSSWYQQILNLSSGFVATHPEFFKQAPVKWNAYNVPYHFYPDPPSVLVLGAGTGNDVAAALRNGAGKAVAVEIDPLILQLGRQLHFEHPYSSPLVHIVVNDARSYIQNSNERFDLIVFSLLDSHTSTSYYTNIRIDNYVYTLEALKATKRLLKPDGLMIVKFQTNTPWIAGRLRKLTEVVFGRPPLQFQIDASGYSTGGRFFICGSPKRIAQALRDPQLSAYVAQHANIPVEEVSLTTDDWPYFYQRQPGVPASVITIAAVLIVLCWLFLRRTGTSMHSVRWYFFFLGAGFLLLEAQIISKMALLFGTTWVVNSIVIAVLLVLIVLSNLLVERRPNIPFTAAYLGIFASISVAYAIPLETFFFASIWLKALTATTVLCLPVFFAGIVFIRSFAREGFSSEALGSNLFGALIGGMLESLSMWTGIRSLLIIAALLYAASWILLGAQKAEAPDLLDAIAPEPQLSANR
jgi:spermidine synthase